jgi:hypothetical protein
MGQRAWSQERFGQKMLKTAYTRRSVRCASDRLPVGRQGIKGLSKTKGSQTAFVRTMTFACQEKAGFVIPNGIRRLSQGRFSAENHAAAWSPNTIRSYNGIDKTLLNSADPDSDNCVLGDFCPKRQSICPTPIPNSKIRTPHSNATDASYFRIFESVSCSHPKQHRVHF